MAWRRRTRAGRRAAGGSCWPSTASSRMARISLSIRAPVSAQRVAQPSGPRSAASRARSADQGRVRTRSRTETPGFVSPRTAVTAADLGAHRGFRSQSVTVRMADGVYSRCRTTRYQPRGSGMAACSSWLSRPPLGQVQHPLGAGAHQLARRHQGVRVAGYLAERRHQPGRARPAARPRRRSRAAASTPPAPARSGRVTVGTRLLPALFADARRAGLGNEGIAGTDRSRPELGYGPTRVATGAGP